MDFEADVAGNGILDRRGIPLGRLLTGVSFSIFPNCQWIITSRTALKALVKSESWVQKSVSEELKHGDF